MAAKRRKSHKRDFYHEGLEGHEERLNAGYRVIQLELQYLHELHGESLLVNNGKWGWFLVDKSVAGGLDDWEVKIADFGGGLGKDAKKFFGVGNCFIR